MSRCVGGVVGVRGGPRQVRQWCACQAASAHALLQYVSSVQRPGQATCAGAPPDSHVLAATMAKGTSRRHPAHCGKQAACRRRQRVALGMRQPLSAACQGFQASAVSVCACAVQAGQFDQRGAVCHCTLLAQGSVSYLRRRRPAGDAAQSGLR